ncbi:hypothetical protein BZA77DRAFT_341251 [Pyronema omphalodes]|nr:hypothetical protein BZA77DRAFT_341251 [Pyronema omphalodes]
MQPTPIFLFSALTGLAAAIPTYENSRRGSSFLQAYEHADYQGFVVPSYSWPWVPWNKCFTLDETRDNKISSFKVEEGCCAFFKHQKCVNRLFEAFNREHSMLGEEHNDQISSYKCAAQCGIRDGEEIEPWR